ncbi:MAG: sigma-70 family RNA polymerase sigma factor [Lacipirellulaceae bacterium]
MASTDSDDEFVLSIIEVQSRLYAYVLSLILDRERAKDVLQQTNVVLLQKKENYQPGTSFFAWAAKTAFYEVLAERRRRGRDKHLFSDDLLAVVATVAAEVAGSLEQRADALRECLALLSPIQRETLLARYRPGGSVAGLADELGKTPNAISALLFRLRSTLLDCVQRRLGRTI